MARMDDGFSTQITFSSNSNIKLYEKEVTPPGVSGGGAIDTTTMLNTTWRTMWPKALKSLTESSFVAAYDPAVFTEIVSIIGDNQLITITFPDDSTLQFWGWLDEFKPNASVEGEQPTAQVTIQPSNQNDSKVEVAPVYAAAP